MLVRLHHLPHDAVDAITDQDRRFPRLDMDIAGPHMDRLGQDGIDKPHHRGEPGQFEQLAVGFFIDSGGRKDFDIR